MAKAASLKPGQTYAQVRQAIYGCPCGCHGPEFEPTACAEDCCAHPNESVLVFSYGHEGPLFEPAPHLHEVVHRRFEALMGEPESKSP